MDGAKKGGRRKRTQEEIEGEERKGNGMGKKWKSIGKEMREVYKTETGVNRLWIRNRNKLKRL